jgi:hypothetical protein
MQLFGKCGFKRVGSFSKFARHFKMGIVVPEVSLNDDLQTNPGSAYNGGG